MEEENEDIYSAKWEKQKNFFYVINIIQFKSWLSDNLPSLTEWSTTMSTKMKGENNFLGSLRRV